jgi:hypothetical protein
VADSQTPNYNLTLIEVGASRDSWGGKLNANMAAIDTALKAVSVVASAALPKAGGAVTGEITNGGALTHWSDDALTDGTAFLAPASGASPLTKPGQIWFGYSS